MCLLRLFKQPYLFNAYRTAVDSFKHSLKTELLPSAICCALLNTSQVILKSMYANHENAQLNLNFGMLSTNNLFKDGVNKNETELLKYVCGLKHKNIAF